MNIIPFGNRNFESGLERRLPYNVEAEQMLLGAILINGDLLSHVNEFLRAEHFYEPLHQVVYQAIIDLDNKKTIISLVTVKATLEQNSSFQGIKGNEYLLKLTTIGMLVLDPYHYGRIIFDLAIKRGLIQIGEDTVNNAYNSTITETATEQIEAAERKLCQLATYGLNEKSFIRYSAGSQDVLNNINNAMKNSDGVTGISTGIAALDEILSGFQNADLIIVAGRPGMGKTAFGINLAMAAAMALEKRAKENANENATENQPEPKSVGFFSLEMSYAQIVTRMVSMRSQIDSIRITNGNLTKEQYNNIQQANTELDRIPIFIDDTPDLSIAAIAARTRKLKRQHNLGILFVDYLQLIKGTRGTKENNRVLEISEITQGLKAIAKELNIPVVALAQLSRAVELRTDKKPILSDLRESGSIEQIADIVMLLYREEYYLRNNKPSENDTDKYNKWLERMNKAHRVAELFIAKHRNGRTGNISLTYNSEICTISDLS